MDFCNNNVYFSKYNRFNDSINKLYGRTGKS